MNARALFQWAIATQPDHSDAHAGCGRQLVESSGRQNEYGAADPETKSTAQNLSRVTYHMTKATNIHTTKYQLVIQTLISLNSR